VRHDDTLPVGAVEALLASLEDPSWSAWGHRAGELLARRPGPGSEPSESRQYVPGDDVRRMDWNATARTGSPYVRDRLHEHDLACWVVLDRSASTAFGTVHRPKEDLAVIAGLTFTVLALRAGGSVGLLTFGGSALTVEPPLASTRAAWHRFSNLWRTAPREGPGTSTDLSPALDCVRGLLGRRRGAVILISDLLVVGGWERSLRRLSAVHDTTAIRVRDARELSLPDVGLVTLADPETGRSVRVDTGDRRFRRRFAAAAAERDRAVDTALRTCDVRALTLRTDDRWASSLAGQLSHANALHRARPRRIAT
jgi:uncharacterized protein (DUF58 family)